MHDAYAFLVALLIATALRLWKTGRLTTIVSHCSWVKRLPKRLQWIVPLVMGAAGNVVMAIAEGVHGVDLLLAALQGMGEIGLVAIGVWHTAKRIVPALRARRLRGTIGWDASEIARELAAVTEMPENPCSENPPPPRGNPASEKKP
jgi:hypothetical protein